MKKNIIYILSGLLCMFVIFSSCDDLLDRPPLDQIGNDSYWKTAKDLENYTIQFYTIFPSFQSPSPYGIFGSDALYGSDDAILAAVNTTLNGSRAVVNSGGNWGWGQIRSVNFFFDNCSRCLDDIKLWQHFLGEAHFFRAYLYFEKVKSYGDVPWYNTVLSMDSEDLYKARDPRTLVIDSIINDLDQAIKYLDPIKTVKGKTNRLTKEAALQFKSRVALYEGSWQKYHAGTPFATPNTDPKKYFRIAVEAAEELMSGDYSARVYGSNIDDYNTMFGLDNMQPVQEIVLWKAYDKSLNFSHNAQVYSTSRTSARSVTLAFVESFLSKEGEPIDYYEVAKTKKGSEFLRYLSEQADPRLSKIIWTPDEVMWNNGNGYKIFTLPYIGQTGEFLNTTGFQLRKGVNVTAPGAGGFFEGNCVTGSIIFRYAEVLLNYAEAKYELDGQVDYNKSINLLRRRAGMPDFKVIKDPNAKRFSDYGYEISDELFEIRRERRVELGAEGFRHIDYRRWRAHQLFQNKRPKGYPVLPEEFPTGTQIPPVDNIGMLDPFQKTIPNGYQFNENRDYLECIPRNEIT
ncbi:RagB/SusD family nutrient uptake outer membrane protein, partial [Parabacteroides sp. OttesenSCG-928-K15]|nr:RagB/SusD family nutrient uptake outer membrane protein [Parabacteroides sp. OttesenSCG-928-K15]